MEDEERVAYRPQLRIRTRVRRGLGERAGLGAGAVGGGDRLLVGEGAGGAGGIEEGMEGLRRHLRPLRGRPQPDRELRHAVKRERTTLCNGCFLP